MSPNSSACGDGVAGEFMLFGVRVVVVVDSMRKSVSLNNLSQYTREDKEDAPTGYASADDVVNNNSGGSRERKRGVPWTEEEHKLFLVGLEKVGKGEWRGISRNYVKSRTPTQVASHAQKYFLRRTNLNCRRRRSSLFDITSHSVLATAIDQHKQSLSPTPSEPGRFTVGAGTIGSVVFIAPVENETICPVPAVSLVNSHLNLNLQSPADDPLPLSLGLSLDSSARQCMMSVA